MRGEIFYELKKYDQAIADYTQAITINPQYLEAYNNRGFAYYKKGNKQQGIKDLQTAKQLYQQQGNTQEAERLQALLNQL